MKIGMMWFSADSKMEFETKIKGAIDFYKLKYNRTPTLIYVHPSMIPSGDMMVLDTTIRTSRSVLPNHFWVGMDD